MVLNSKIRKIIRDGMYSAGSISWVPADGLIWDSTNGKMYKRTTDSLMKSIIFTSEKSAKIKFDGTMYYLGELSRMMGGLSQIMRQKVANGDIK